jgi:SAM-dependent methyltransferase
MSQRVDFSANACVYDRRHGSVLAADLAQQLASSGALASGARVLDIGAGTGRVAIAFAAIGCETVALDPSVPMLNELRRKAPECRMQVVAGEGARLPFAIGRFDGVICARVLYLMSDWRDVLREASRVLRSGGCLLHEWGNGQADEAWVQIREKARALFEAAGAENPFHPGARAESEVEAFIGELGFEPSADQPTGAGPTTTLRDFLGRVASGELSYIWNVPDPIRESCLPQLMNWCDEAFDLERPVPIPRDLHWTIYRKAA